MQLELTDNFHALIVVHSPANDPGKAIAELAAQGVPGVRVIAAAPAENITPVVEAQSPDCSHVICLSSGDSYSRDDLVELIRQSQQAPTALVLGRVNAQESPPVFERMCNLLLRLETGHRIHRSDCPRVFPIELIRAVDPAAQNRFDETEMLVRSLWAKCPVVIAPITNRPAASSQSIPPRQMLREMGLHVRLIARALRGVPKYHYSGATPPAPRQSFWRIFWRWLNPFDAWRELRQGGAGRNEMAVGLGVGAFIGNMPTWGFHAVLSLYVARRLHLNPLAVMTGSHVSAPPMGPALVASAMWIGHVILHRAPPKWENITPFHGKFWANAPSLLLDWTLGALIVGTVVAIAVYLIANFLFRFVEKRKTDTEAAVEF